MWVVDRLLKPLGLAAVTYFSINYLTRSEPLALGIAVAVFAFSAFNKLVRICYGVAALSTISAAAWLIMSPNLRQATSAQIEALPAKALVVAETAKASIDRSNSDNLNGRVQTNSSHRLRHTK